MISKEEKIQRLLNMAEHSGLSREDVMAAFREEPKAVANTFSEFIIGAKEIVRTKIEERRTEIRNLAEGLRTNLLSDIRTEQENAVIEIEQLSVLEADLKDKIRQKEKELEVAKQNFEVAQGSVNDKNKSIHEADEYSKKIEKNSRKLIKYEKRGFFRNIFSNFFDKFFTKPKDLTVEEKESIILGEADVPKAGTFSMAKDAIKDAKKERDDKIKETKEMRDEGLSVFDTVRSELELQLQELRQNLSEKQSRLDRVTRQKESREKNVADISRQADDWKDELDYLKTQEDKLNGASTGKVIAKSAIKGIKESLKRFLHRERITESIELC